MNSSKPADLGRTIALRRKQLGVTQEELAALAGVSVRFLSSLERGKPTVRLDTLLAVLDTLGLELRTVVRGTA
ncbi:helix-turn-helix transcriptional regulator [Parafrigoribacterium humi]|uniref:helix-turn-helix transcriptional regulator n=1 Tax=Parafrigoribacterium humi TaxID=3144664 RepID=UPI0032ECC993